MFGYEKQNHTQVHHLSFASQVVSVQSAYPEERLKFATTAAGTTVRAAIRTTPSSSLLVCCTTGTPVSTRWEERNLNDHNILRCNISKLNPRSFLCPRVSLDFI